MIKRFTCLFIAALASLNVFAQNPAPCSDLFFSEYIEGTSNNKALEIFNPTGGTIDLENYKIWISYNGGTSTSSIDLIGTVVPDSTFIIANSNASSQILEDADQTNGALNFNGNDAVALINTLTNDTLDIIGIIGDAPTNAWFTSSGDSTANATLIRIGSVHNGFLDWSNAANNSDSTWASTGIINDFSNLEVHYMSNCVNLSDPIVSFATDAQSFIESAGTVDISITITYPNANPTSVQVAIQAGGFATEGTDYTTVGTFPQTVTFPASSGTPQTVSFNIIDDATSEPTEYFVLQLSNVNNNGSIDIAIDTIYINDNDQAGVPPNLYIYPLTDSVTEGTNFTSAIQVQIGGSNSNPTTVELVVVGSGTTATFGNDYNFSSPLTATFPPLDNSSQIVFIEIIDDAIQEGTETIKFQLTNPTNSATINPLFDTVQITILDTDTLIISVAELKQFGMYAWPNPVSERCNINATQVVNECNIYSMSGQLMFSTKPFANKFKIEVADLPAALYIVEAITDYGILHYRLMKK